jgi:hypothetical protein
VPLLWLTHPDSKRPVHTGSKVRGPTVVKEGSNMLTKGAGCADGCCPTAPPSPNTVAKLVTADPRVVGVGDAFQNHAGTDLAVH